MAKTMLLVTFITKACLALIPRYQMLVAKRALIELSVAEPLPGAGAMLSSGPEHDHLEEIRVRFILSGEV